MKISNTLLILCTLGAVLFFGFTQVQENKQALSGVNCTVTESKVSIGDDSATTVLSAGVHEWAIIQQPISATNTVSLSIGGTAVSGSGYQLASSSTTVGSQQLVLGFATDLPASDAVSAITNLGSSTINVITCR